MSVPTATRLSSVDFARVIAMVAVILIHVTSTYINAESSVALWGINLAFFLNQAARFCVPLFLFLSGLSLGLGRKDLPWPAFYQDRAVRILPPYLFWCLVYWLRNCGFDPAALAGQPADPRRVLTVLLTGEPAAQLYFIPIILQCYLLYPLLKKWVDRAPGRCFVWSLALSLVCQGGFYWQFAGVLPACSNPHLWLLFPTWSFYFVAGMCLTPARLDRLSSFCGRTAPALLATGAVALILYVADARHTGAIHAVKPALLFVTPLVFLCALAVWQGLGRWAAAEGLTRFLSAHSMGIYYNHVLVLYFLRPFPRFSGGMSGMLLLFTATFFLSLAVAVLLRLTAKTLRRAVGRALG